MSDWGKLLCTVRRRHDWRPKMRGVVCDTCRVFAAWPRGPEGVWVEYQDGSRHDVEAFPVGRDRADIWQWELRLPRSVLDDAPVQMGAALFPGQTAIQLPIRPRAR